MLAEIDSISSNNGRGRAPDSPRAHNRIASGPARFAAAQSIGSSLAPVGEDGDFTRREEFDLANQAVAAGVAPLAARTAPDLVARDAQRVFVLQRFHGRV